MTEQPPSISSEPLCEGDTTIIPNVLPPALAADAFEHLLEEVSWATMSHMGGEVPRRIAVQGAVADDGSMPVYRHPADESPPLLPFSPTVLQIKNEIEKHLGHELNHVLIQHYRTGNDYISEHSDKTLDIAPGSFIANVSLGAERTMIFRTKRPPRTSPPLQKERRQQRSPRHPDDSLKPARQTIRAALPHNSLCRMGLATNERWLHAIRQDKRADCDKSAPELAHAGARISLTFRRIGTFIDAAQARVWGQGATAKTCEDAKPVVNGQTEEAVRMLQAFGAENNQSAFDWGKWYGKGFDVLHMGVPKRFFASTTADVVHNASVGIALAELGVGCAKGSVEGQELRFEDNDPGAGWRGEVAVVAKLLKKELADWEGWAAAAAAEASSKDGRSETDGKTTESAEPTSSVFYIANTVTASPADFAVWPVLHNMVQVCGEELLGENLRRYYIGFKERSSVGKVLGGAVTASAPTAEKAE
ncbi:hypothetical protein N0V88_007628 [Collariella sp. IMI 366227]|nr:hypothetical protein N0V88_007628 [Collariella sp. IMI 366227]